uniref:Uncharacterized protein n=1 Tax=Hyaloperonospora arabidopsidis (strain Emoy2) TaxID=559515 RepID=M4BSN3_HYAAE
MENAQCESRRSLKCRGISSANLENAAAVFIAGRTSVMWSLRNARGLDRHKMHDDAVRSGSQPRPYEESTETALESAVYGNDRCNDTTLFYAPNQ